MMNGVAEWTNLKSIWKKNGYGGAMWTALYPPMKRRLTLQSLGAYIRDAARTLYRGHIRRYALHYKSAIYPYHAGNNGTLFLYVKLECENLFQRLSAVFLQGERPGAQTAI